MLVPVPKDFLRPRLPLTYSDCRMGCWMPNCTSAANSPASAVPETCSWPAFAAAVAVTWVVAAAFVASACSSCRCRSASCEGGWWSTCAVEIAGKGREKDVRKDCNIC